MFVRFLPCRLQACNSNSLSYDAGKRVPSNSVCQNLGSWIKLDDRLIHQPSPSQVFHIVQLTPAEAQARLSEMLAAQARCHQCSHPPFTGVLLGFFKDEGETEQAARHVQAALYDTALASTCSSQAVEKMHAHVQVAQKTLQNAGPRPSTVQRQTYIMAARLAHSRLKGLIELEVFGKQGLLRARKLMSFRVVSTSKPANASLRNYAPTEESSSRKRRAFVRKNVLKIQPAKKVQKAPNLWHAFLALMKGKKLNEQAVELSMEYKTWLSSGSSCSRKRRQWLPAGVILLTMCWVQR